MNPVVSIIMGSTSDLPIMEKAAKFLDEMEVPFEINALSAHRTPEEVEIFSAAAVANIFTATIAASAMTAYMSEVISSITSILATVATIKASPERIDSLHSIVYMTPGV